MRFSLIPFLLLVVPLAEIAAFVVIGGQIGVWATLGMVLLTAIIGSILLRWQGVGLFNRINTELRANRVPGRELVHGVMILIAGVLLLTPGFVTDSLGFLLFVPGIRDLVWRSVKDRIVVQTMSAALTAEPEDPGKQTVSSILTRTSSSAIPILHPHGPKRQTALQGRASRTGTAQTGCKPCDEMLAQCRTIYRITAYADEQQGRARWQKILPAKAAQRQRKHREMVRPRP
jgi:UPF0716 family protein affecting phage T7 exclusion